MQVEQANEQANSSELEFEDLTRAVLALSYDISSVRQQLGARSCQHAAVAQVTDIVQSNVDLQCSEQHGSSMFGPT